VRVHTGLDTSYRAACIVIILLLGLIWWVGFVDVCNAFRHWFSAVFG
jgi:hypothetical protein